MWYKKIPIVKKKQNLSVSGGDIAAKLGKLPGTPWAKYPGVKYLPGYNYCGPGTRLDDQNQPKPGEYPINAIDNACHVHDVAYYRCEINSCTCWYKK